MTSTPKIAVIGAGISGIAAAHELIKHGLTDVTVYEALKRIGGRINTLYYKPNDGSPSYHLEMGANWIHGTRGNAIFELAKANGLLHDASKRPKFCRYDVVDLTIDGEKIPPNLFRAVSKWYARQLQDCEAVFETDPLPDTDLSLESVIRQNFGAFLEQLPAKDHELCEQILNHKLAYETSLAGCDSMSQVSCNQSGSYVYIPGPDPEIPAGFIKVVESLRKIIPDSQIHLNTTVTKITYKNTLETPDEKITLELGNGTTAQFDHIIITSSINFLQRHHRSLFAPGLPMEKAAALERCAMGTVDKLFVRFPHLGFVPATWRYIRFVWPRDEDRSRWTSRMFALSVLNTARQDTLMVWLTGEGAERMEKLSNDEVIDGVMDVLSRLLRQNNLPRPVELVRSRWASEPTILGSYSYVPVGGSVENIKQLAQPILHHASEKPLIQFAGEGTHPQFYSTTHGALLSGRREASILLQYYGMK